MYGLRDGAVNIIGINQARVFFLLERYTKIRMRIIPDPLWTRYASFRTESFRNENQISAQA